MDKSKPYYKISNINLDTVIKHETSVKKEKCNQYVRLHSKCENEANIYVIEDHPRPT